MTSCTVGYTVFYDVLLTKGIIKETNSRLILLVAALTTTKT